MTVRKMIREPAKPMSAASRNPHSQLQAATTAAIITNEMNSPMYGLVQNML